MFHRVNFHTMLQQLLNRVALTSLSVFLAASIANAAPSEACKEGAAACQSAVEKLDTCKKSDDAKKDGACAAEKTAANDACEKSNSACVQGTAKASKTKSKSKTSAKKHVAKE